MRPCVIDPCGKSVFGYTMTLCLGHWNQLDDRTKDRLYWTFTDWREDQTAKNAKAYHKAVALAVAELTAMQASVEAGRAS